ncbi:MAG TPA: ribonuclease HII [Kiritimatiellia bacterium]|nr:ribonuclease HII [Kiritimatiellia bacterium]HRU71775.1 ribonuclease HII [Kiritimatiellia bacterium]
MLRYEKAAWKQRPSLVLAGVDEAGRGCLAGPVVAGAVMMPPDIAECLYANGLAGLTDSKQLSAARREAFYQILTTTPGVIYATGWCSAAEIDRLNILSATHLAMRRALEALPVMPDLALVDGLPVRRLPCESNAIVQGDAKSFLIAAASVIAKVSRDRYMVEAGARYPLYGFAEHKGYGVHAHVTALFKHGSCPEHRHTFRPVQDVDQKLTGFEF